MEPKPAKWVKGLGAGFAAAVGVVSGSLSIAVNLGWETTGFWLLVAENSFWIVPIACLIVGLLCGWLLHASVVDAAARQAAAVEEAKQAGETERKRMDQEKEEAEARAREEREKANREELEEMRLAQIAEKVRKAHGDAKPAIVFLYDHGPVRDAFLEDIRPASALERDMFDHEALPGNVGLDNLSPHVRKAIDEHPEVLEETRRVLAANPHLQWRYSSVGDPDPVSSA